MKKTLKLSADQIKPIPAKSRRSRTFAPRGVGCGACKTAAVASF